MIQCFAAEQLNPNSYDFRLGRRLLRYTEPVLDPRRNNAFEYIEMSEDGFVIEKGSFYLGHTDEVLGSIGTRRLFGGNPRSRGWDYSCMLPLI